MKILIITPSLPYPPHWGFGIRVFQLLKHLAIRHEVSLLTYAHPKDTKNIADLREYCHEVYTVPPVIVKKRRNGQMASLFSARSYLQSSLFSTAFQAKIDEILLREKFDIIQVESSHLGGFRLGGESALILDEHNIEYELLQRMYRTEKAPARRLFNWSEFVKFRREEQQCWERADGVIVTSDREREHIADMRPGKPIVCGPNGVDVEFFKPEGAKIDSNSIVMTGLMRYRPNIDAALYMVHEILPRIHQTRPDVTFTIVGAGPPAEITDLAGPHVVVTNAVPDVRPYCQSAGALVVPLRMGSGTRLKVLEGLSMGKAMVSTSVGCEGIDVRDGEHLLAADDAPAFAEAVLRVLDDAALAAELGRAGRALAVSRYSWETVGEKVEKFHAEVLALRRDASRSSISTASAKGRYL